MDLAQCLLYHQLSLPIISAVYFLSFTYFLEALFADVLSLKVFAPILCCACTAWSFLLFIS